MLKDKIKILLGAEFDGSDAALEIVADEVEACVLEYTHRTELSGGLESAAARIGAEVYMNAARGGVTLISEGDRRVEFSLQPGGYIDAYADILERFRSKRGYVPSDIVFDE